MYITITLQVFYFQKMNQENLFFENEYSISLAHMRTPRPPQGHCSLPCCYQFLSPAPNCRKTWKKKKSCSTADLQPRLNRFYVIKQEQFQLFKERRAMGFFCVTEYMRSLSKGLKERLRRGLVEWLGLVAVEFLLSRSKATDFQTIRNYKAGRFSQKSNGKH